MNVLIVLGIYVWILYMFYKYNFFVVLFLGFKVMKILGVVISFINGQVFEGESCLIDGI